MERDSMHIKKLTIKNFRVFDEEGITLQFNKGVNAIIGETVKFLEAEYASIMAKIWKEIE